MANYAKKTTDEQYYERIAFVTGAILLAYSSLEAALNEFVQLNARSTSSPLSEAERKVIVVIGEEKLVPQERAHVLQLFNLMLRILGKKEIALGGSHYQSANLVRALRNMLTHPSPGSVTTFVEGDDVDLSSQQEIVKKLRAALGLGETSDLPGRHPYAELCFLGRSVMRGVSPRVRCQIWRGSRIHCLSFARKLRFV
jgi:hypothetical protein